MAVILGIVTKRMRGRLCIMRVMITCQRSQDESQGLEDLMVQFPSVSSEGPLDSTIKLTNCLLDESKRWIPKEIGGFDWLTLGHRMNGMWEGNVAHNIDKATETLLEHERSIHTTSRQPWGSGRHRNLEIHLD
jgi:hypothetical protein